MRCKIKQYTGCAICYKRYDCGECEPRMNSSDVLVGMFLLISIFVVITWFIMGG